MEVARMERSKRQKVVSAASEPMDHEDVDDLQLKTKVPLVAEAVRGDQDDKSGATPVGLKWRKEI